MKRNRFVKRNKIAKGIGAVFFVLILLTAVVISIWGVIKDSEKPHYTYTFEAKIVRESTETTEIIQSEVALTTME